MQNEHPIIFSTPMVNAIQDGRKTQTRRAIKPQPFIVLDGTPIKIREAKPGEFPIQREDIKCPYGQVGDRLWVRETWAVAATLNLTKPSMLDPDGIIYYKASYENKSHFVWRPSIFMPRWASRITLEITEIRVERVQEITEEDALLEGCETYWTLPGGNVTARYHYYELWDSINAKRGYSWDTNPWVWAISLKVI